MKNHCWYGGALVVVPVMRSTWVTASGATPGWSRYVASYRRSVPPASSRSLLVTGDVHFTMSRELFGVSCVLVASDDSTPAPKPWWPIHLGVVSPEMASLFLGLTCHVRRRPAFFSRLSFTPCLPVELSNSPVT